MPRRLIWRVRFIAALGAEDSPDWEANLDRHPALIVMDGLERELIAYARGDAAKLSDEDAFFAVDNSVPSLTGRISYVDTMMSGSDQPSSSKVTYALNANKLYGYTINAKTGVPTLISSSPFATGGGPAFISNDAEGQFVFVGNQSTSNVSVFRITQSTGVLTSIQTESVLSAPTSMVVTK